MRFTSLFLLLVPASAFTSKSAGARIATELSSTPTRREPKNFEKAKELDYGEESRRYRRTVYTHDDWVIHRSPDRFAKNIITTTSSGIYKNVARETLVTVAVATLVITWNMATGGYTDFDGIQHDGFIHNTFLPTISMPLTPFTMSSPFLGYLLVFRTNAAYKRWDEARKNWGMNINHTRDLVRMGNTFYDDSGVTKQVRKRDLERLSLCTWAFVRSMKRHLSPEWEDEEYFKSEMYKRLPESQAKAIIDAAHRPNRALYDLSLAIENLPMHFMRKNQIQNAVTIFEDNLGSSERLLTSPVPIFYQRHVARFLSFWLLFLPIALYEPFGNTWNHIVMVPAVAIISLFLFGIEELATQMEEPFTILPMQAFCDKIGNWCNEIVTFEDGDNGITTKKSFQGHASAYFESETGRVGGKKR